MENLGSKSVMSSNGRREEKPILFPCTCGQSEIELLEFNTVDNGWTHVRWGYWCHSCGNATTPCFTAEDARLQWNRKIEPDRQKHVLRLAAAGGVFSVSMDDEPMHNDLPLIHTSTERIGLLEKRIERIEAVIKAWTGDK